MLSSLRQSMERRGGGRAKGMAWEEENRVVLNTTHSFRMGGRAPSLPLIPSLPPSSASPLRLQISVTSNFPARK